MMSGILLFMAGVFFGAVSGVFAVALLSANRTYEYMQGETGGDEHAGNEQE